MAQLIWSARIAAGPGVLPVPDLVGAEDFTIRQKFVNLIPALLAVGIVETLIVAGAPDQAPDVYRLLRRIAEYGWAGAAGLTIGAVLLALLLEPLELATIRFLEGYWRPSGWLGRVAVIGIWIQERRRSRLRWIRNNATDEAQKREAVLRLAELPRLRPLLPTHLGNTLRGVEEQAGLPYELDALVAWPRLFDALPEQTLKQVAQGRNQLDTAARLCLSLGASAVVSVGLLARHSWWLLAPAAMVLLAAVAYRAAVAAAGIYGTSVFAAFDVHRLRLLQLMRVEVPRNLSEERELNKTLTKLWKRTTIPSAEVKYSRTDTDVGLHHQ
jgi:hypothetical protein